MEKIKIEQDIALMYIAASSFPEGVMQAHQHLHGLVAFDNKRRFFGLSRPEQGSGIQYKAAAEILTAGEEKKLDLPQLSLSKGNYIAIRINDFRKDVSAITKTFSLLLAQANLDPQGYCVESYPNQTDVICMVRLIN
jgi:hypothetical protein